MGSLTIWDSTKADLSLSGEQMYQRSIVRLLGSVNTPWQDARVASFNVGSGAFHCLVISGTTIFSGTAYELHTLFPPDEKDRALDSAISRIRLLKELPLESVLDARVYSLGTEVLDVQDVYYLSYPVASKGIGQLNWWKLVTTATGQEVRIQPTLDVSQQLIVQAITQASLGPADTATINLPDEDWVLSGAAAQAYWLLEARAPATEVRTYQGRRREMVGMFQRLSSRFQPQVTRKIQLDEWN